MNKKLYKRLEYILYKIYKSIFAKMCPWPKQPRKGGQNGARREQILEYPQKKLHIPIKTKYDIIQTSINFTMLCMTSKC
jgi:hypothetical protein